MPSTSSSSSLTRWLSRLVLTAVFLWIGWSWVLRPMQWLNHPEDLKPPIRPPAMPSADFLKRLDNYKRAIRSPFLRQKALRHSMIAIRNHINPSRISRSFRALLQKGKLPQWPKRTQRWESIIHNTQRQYPHLSLTYLRGFLYLYTGQFNRLRRWGQRHTKPPKTRQEALLAVWMGHACFWSGHPKAAKAHYQRAVQSMQAHPKWTKQSPYNWRLPTEENTTLYHLGLLALLEGQPAQARQWFVRLAQQRKRVSPTAHRDKLWYLAQLWAAQAATEQKKREATRKHLIQAGRFAYDATLQKFAMARFFADKDKARAHIWLTRVYRFQQSHPHSYKDSTLLAGLHQARLLLQAKPAKVGKAQTHLRFALQKLHARPSASSLHTLLRKDTTRIYALPAPPSFFATLRHALQKIAPNNPPRHTAPKARPASRPIAKTPPAPRPAAKAATPASQPTSASAAPGPPTTRPTKRTKAPPLTLASIRQALLLLEAIAHLRRHHTHNALRLLKKLLHTNTRHVRGHHTLGLLYSAQGHHAKALPHWRFVHQHAPNRLRRAYLVYTLHRLKKHKEAKRIFKARNKHKRWTRTWRHLKALLAKKPLYSKARLQQSNFWGWIFGPFNWLSDYDPQLMRLSRVWHATPLQQTNPQIWSIFRSLSVSTRPTRLSLATVLLKTRLLLRHARLHKRSYTQLLRQERFLSSLFRRFPHQQYLLENTFYHHHWGVIAPGLY